MSHEYATESNSAPNAEWDGRSIKPVVIALVELFAFFGLIYAAQYLATGRIGPIDISPHPFWIPVLLLAVQYGTGLGLVAALAASALYHVTAWPVVQAGEDYQDFLIRVFAVPALWLITATVLGTFRDRHLKKERGNRAEIVGLHRRLDSLGSFCLRLEGQNRKLQRQIAKQKWWSADSINRIVATLNSFERTGLARAVGRACHLLLGERKYAFFSAQGDRRTGDGLTLVCRHGWQESKAGDFSREGLARTEQRLRDAGGSKGGGNVVIGVTEPGLFAAVIRSARTDRLQGLLCAEAIAGEEPGETASYLRFLATQISHALDARGEESVQRALGRRRRAKTTRRRETGHEPCGAALPVRNDRTGAGGGRNGAGNRPLITSGRSAS